MMSDALPAPSGTTKVTVRDGQSCADAVPEIAGGIAKQASRLVNMSAACRARLPPLVQAIIASSLISTAVCLFPSILNREIRRKRLKPALNGNARLGDKKKADIIIVNVGGQAFDLVALVDLFERQDRPITRHNTYSCTKASAVVVGVLSVFGDRGEHHAAVRQARAIGEAQGDVVDLAEIDRLDCDRRDRSNRISGRECLQERG